MTTGVLRHDDVLMVFIDMQSRLADVMPRREAVVATSVLLARCAAILGIPVVVTRQYPEGLGDTVPELREATHEAAAVDKVHFSCPAAPVFRDTLLDFGRRQVVLAGMETHICVLQTAFALRDEGFEVHVVADATCSRRDADNAIALDRLRAGGITVTTAESVIYEALGQAATPEFKAVLAVVKGHPL